MIQGIPLFIALTLYRKYDMIENQTNSYQCKLTT